MILILFFLDYAMSQQQCINLAADSPCGPSFEGAPVAFASIEEFSANIQLFSNTTASKNQINQLGKCNISNDDALKQQYQSSFFCTFIVSDALGLGCTANSPYVPENNKLCSKVCNAAKDSVTKSLSSCEDPNIITGGFQSFCANNVSNDAKCFQGIQSEVSFCGFRSNEAAVIGCPSLRENDADTECCKRLFPQVVFLPAADTEEKQGITMTIGIGIAVGVAAFLILAGLLASVVWLSTPKKSRPKSIVGNSLMKNTTFRDSISSTSSNYTIPIEKNQKTPLEYESAQFKDQNMSENKSFNESFQKGSKIGMGNPYKTTVPVNQNDSQKFLQVPSFPVRDSMMSDISGNHSVSRNTIDLDVLSMPDEEQYESNPVYNQTQNTINSRDSVFYMRGGAGAPQSMYNTLLLQQFSDINSIGDTEIYQENQARNYESMHSSSTDQFIVNEGRNSTMSITFPSPPNNPPKK